MITFKKKCNDIRIKYGEIVNASENSNGEDAIDDVWNVYNIQKVPDRKCGNFSKKCITEDDRRDMTSKKVSRKSKETFPENKRKHNVSLAVLNETQTKNHEVFFVNNKPYFLKLKYRSYLNPVWIINKNI